MRRTVVLLALFVSFGIASIAQSCPQDSIRVITSYGSYCSPISALSKSAATLITCPSSSADVTLHASAAPEPPYLEIIRCGANVLVLGKEGEWYKVRAQSGKEGYVRETFVAAEIPVDKSLQQQPSRASAETDESRQRDDSHQYPLRIKVLQTEQVPYVVQYGGGQVSTSCDINGTGTTTGTAVLSGNAISGNSFSNMNLSMNCNTYQSPPMGWGHMLNTMLVVASNQNAYIIACDAAWRWSKCRGLVTGDIFRARMTTKGIEVEYLDKKGKAKRATYIILRARVLGN